MCTEDARLHCCADISSYAVKVLQPKKCFLQIIPLWPMHLNYFGHYFFIETRIDDLKGVQRPPILPRLLKDYK